MTGRLLMDSVHCSKCSAAAKLVTERACQFLALFMFHKVACQSVFVKTVVTEARTVL